MRGWGRSWMHIWTIRTRACRRFSSDDPVRRSEKVKWQLRRPECSSTCVPSTWEREEVVASSSNPCASRFVKKAVSTLSPKPVCSNSGRGGWVSSVVSTAHQWAFPVKAVLLLTLVGVSDANNNNNNNKSFMSSIPICFSAKVGSTQPPILVA